MNKIYNLYDWAYLGDIPKTMASLEKRSSPLEYWGSLNGKQRYPGIYILYEHQLITFKRLQIQDKVLYSSDQMNAGYHTGLSDEKGNPIICLFKHNKGGCSDWVFDKYITYDTIGQKLLAESYCQPFEPATFADRQSDLVYETKYGKPCVDFHKVVYNVIHRYPSVYIERYGPPDFIIQNINKDWKSAEKRHYYQQLKDAICLDNECTWSMKCGLEEAIEGSMKWLLEDYSLAVPIYYPQNDCLCLALPLCFLHPRVADLALIVRLSAEYTYEAVTVLPLDIAYIDARVVSRVHSEWLNAKKIYQYFNN